MGCGKRGGGAGPAIHWNKKGLILVPLLSEAPHLALLFGEARLLSLLDKVVCCDLLVLHCSVVWNVGEDEECVIFGSKYWNRFEGSAGVNEKKLDP